MGRPVRIRQDVAVRVEGLASVEKRSFANMVEVLLLGALDVDGAGPVRPRSSSGEERRHDKAEAAGSIPASGDVPANPRMPRSVSVRAHMKKHRPAVQCPTLIDEGECPDCGTIVDNA